MVIIHNNTESAYDRTAQKMIHYFFVELRKMGTKPFLKYLKAQKQTSQDFSTVVFLDPNGDYLFRKTVEKAYADALRADCETPSFIRWWRDGDTTNIIAAVECSLFADLNPDNYRDEKGWLKQELKDIAIQEIKRNLLVV